MIKPQQITAVILAGGRSSRMNGEDKGLIKINQKPLISSIIEVIKNEVGTILINANRNQEQYQHFSKNPIVSDDSPDFQGPLAGIAKAMAIAKTPYLLVLPCDCPSVSITLLDCLKTTMATQNSEICVAHDGQKLQPTFALLKTNLLNSLLQYLQQGNRKVSLWYQQQQMVIADLSTDKQSFVNLNTPEDFALYKSLNFKLK